MSQDVKGWIQFIAVTSPVLVAALIGMVILINTLLNPFENTLAPTPTVAPTQVIHVTAHQLYAEYQADAIAADARYKAKQIEVSGIVASWREDTSSKPYFTLVTDDSGGNFVKVEFTYDYFVPPTKEEQRALLGQEITWSGTCLGLSQGIVTIMDNFSRDDFSYYIQTRISNGSG